MSVGRALAYSAVATLALLLAGLGQQGTVNLSDIDPGYPPAYVPARGFPIEWLVTAIPPEIDLQSPPRVYPYGLFASFVFFYVVSLSVLGTAVALRGLARAIANRKRAA